MPDVGSVIAGYRVVRVLGSGGMGSVYLAHDPDLPRLSALKVLSSAHSNDPEFRARFLREAAVASGLSHPNIVAIHRRGETAAGQLWMAMQFVDGDDADGALRAGTMSPQRAVRIVGEVARALDYAHRHHVVHRDIKPANFLLTAQEGAAERVLLGDFGIARALDDVGLTTTGSVLATMSYAAPEVLAGQLFDGRADVYSLGCSLFRLLTGALPFPGDNGPAAVMMAHLHAPPPRVTELVSALPTELDAVVARAMAKDPALRFSTAGELADAARDALRAASPAVSRAPLPGQRVDVARPADPGWWRTLPSPHPEVTARRVAGRGRRRLGWAAVGIAAAIVVVATAVSVFQPARFVPPAAVSPTTEAATPASSAPALVSLPALTGLLLDDITSRTALDTASVRLVSTSAALLDSTAEIADNDKQCVSAWAPAQVAAYGNAGFTGVQVQVLNDGQPLARRNAMTQAVILFPTLAAADGAVTAQIKLWKQCANRTITVTVPGNAATTVTLGEPRGLTGMNRLLSQQVQSAPALHCQRALASRNNLVIDIAACSASVQDPARAVIGVILGKVPPG